MEAEQKPLDNGLGELPQNEARFVEGEGKTQLQVDVLTYIKDKKRQNVLANLVLNDVAKLEYMIAKALSAEIEVLYEQFNPQEKQQIISPIEC